MGKMLEKEKWLASWKHIKPPLNNIYYKGNIELLTTKRPRLAIVGSRRMTEYGSKIIEKWMSTFVDAGIIIVSGFMYGVDQKAHLECLKNGGETIAVFGWGIDWRVAESDVEIYEKILLSNSLMLSEYEGEEVPELWKFPQRNRIVAGISDAILVIEGAEKSGSMITAKLAIKFDKQLFALPGPVTSKVAEGTNNLIKRGDAKMATCAEDVLRGMGLGVGQMSLLPSDGGKINGKDTILEILEYEVKSVDEISRILKVPVHEVLSRLSNLSLQGLVEEKNGKYFLL